MSAEEFVAKSYDYVIIGGGTAGLTIAARLSEDPNVTVGVLEAGGSHLGDPMVDIPGLHLQLLDSPKYDWAYKTEPQKNTANKVQAWPRGKGLGGSSAINFMMFSQASKGDVDNWAKLGNNGWSWDDLQQYYRKFETYIPAPEALGNELKDSYLDASLRGTDGPVKITFSTPEVTWLHKSWPAACLEAGYPDPQDPRNGSSLGGFHQLQTINPETVTRSYSANAFYAPNAERPNLSVCTDAHVSRVVFDPKTDSSDLTATGVEFSTGSKKYVVKAKKEVIVSAGVIGSPQILELSGVGSPEVLKSSGIDCLIENPAVGENLQDHTAIGFAWQVNEGLPTAETILHSPEIQQQAMEAFMQHKTGPFAQGHSCSGFVATSTLYPEMTPEQLKSHIESLSASAPKDAYSQTVDPVLLDSLLAETEAVAQVVAFPSGVDPTQCDRGQGTFFHTSPDNYMLIGFCSTRPFSRGSVHIKSASPEEHPRIDPAYMTHPIDAEMGARGLMHIQKLIATKSLADNIKKDENGGLVLQPGFSLPTNLEEAKEIAQKNTVTEYHPIGSCSMLPKEKGGVVDANLKVYGTANLRVCDASIMPTHVQGNIVSIVYAIAEKGADLVKSSA